MQRNEMQYRKQLVAISYHCLSQRRIGWSWVAFKNHATHHATQRAANV